MTDLWYTFGAMVADPGLLTAIGNTKPKFQTIGMAVTETVAGQPDLKYTRLGAGYLDRDSTTLVRGTIRENLPAGAPPISLYTAGKMCQLWNTLEIPKQGLTTSAARGNAAFSKAGGKAVASSAVLLTITGLCLLDRPFVTQIILGPDASAAAKEFGIDQQSKEWNVLQNMLKDTNFGAAQDALLSAPCWSGNQACGEVYVFYPNFIRAVN